MPILAIGAAAIAIGGAASGVAAAGLTLMTALEITAAVGATISAIGVVTKDKDLAMAGAIIGGIGAVGSFAAGAGLLGSDATTAPLFGSGSASGGSVAQAGALPGEAAAAGDPSALASSSDIVDSLGGVSQETGLATSNIDQAISAASGNASDLGLSGLTSPMGSSASGGLLNAPSEFASGDISAMAPANFSLVSDGSAPPVAGMGGTASPAAPGVSAPTSPDVSGLTPAHTMASMDSPQFALQDPTVLGSILNFSKTNPSVTLGVLQAGGAFLSGATSSLTPAQVAALNAQAAQNRAATALTTTQQANMAAPIPIASRQPNITGAPAGIINSPPPTNNITGQVAA